MAAEGLCGDAEASGVNCDEALSTLYTYLDGELTAQRRALDHLAPRPVRVLR